MKRHAPGLYTMADDRGRITAISRECECSGYCGGKWVQRDIVEWVDGYPSELGAWGLAANSKRELLALIAEVDAR